MHLAGTIRKLMAVAVAVVVVGAVGVVGVGGEIGATAADESMVAGATGVQTFGVTADIEYTCRNVTVMVKPKDVQYDLVIYYEDTVTGRQGKALVGPMAGKTVEPYGNGIVFTSVDVMVNGATIGSETILAKCYPDTKESTRDGRSSIRTDSGDSKWEARSRNPVPVAMATTDSS